jgi:Domain of unknown function (DUF4836)
MKLRLLLILSASVLLFASCGNKGGSSGLMIPKDAALVVHINSPSLSSKLSWDEIKQSNWFTTMQKGRKTSDTLVNELLANPGSSGINLNADMIFYIKKHGRGSYMIFAGALTDAAAFEKLCKDMHKQAEIKKDGDFSYISSADKGSVVWNTSHFAYAANAPVPGMNRAVEKGETFQMPNQITSDSLRILGVEALTLKASDNLDSDERFTSLIKDSSDVHIWMNIGKYFPGGTSEMMPAIKTDFLLEDNISATSINFDNGKITAKSKQYYNEKMRKLFADYKAEPVSAAVINRIPSSNVAGVLAFNYPPAGLKALLKMVGVDALADMFLAQAGFSIDEFVKANKGEILLSISDPAAKQKQDTGKSKSSFDMNVLFATSVNDKPSFEKMITLAWDFSKKFREGGLPKDMPEISYKLENNWFAASNSADFRDKFLAGGDSKLPFANKISGHPFALYIDLQKLTGMHPAFGNADTSSKTGAANTLNIWEDMIATGGDYKDKATHFDFEINFIDKNTNSLKQINQYFDKMHAMKKERIGDIREIRIDEIKQEKNKPEPPPPPPAKKKTNK